MPQTTNVPLTEDDLAPLKNAQKLIASMLDGQEVPIELLASIAVRSIDSHGFAMTVLSELTGKPTDEQITFDEPQLLLAPRPPGQ